MSVGRWSWRYVWLGLTFVLASGPALVGGAAFAQDASPAASASTPLPTLAPTPTPVPRPQPVVTLPVMPTDADLASAARTVVVDTPSYGDAPVDLTAVAAAASDQVNSMTTAAWSIHALADSFDGDPARAFAFMRDSIGFDVYPGVLRGAEGTLAARAGNAYDRALLLKALLDSMALASRFAFADLDQQTAGQVADLVFRAPAAPLQDGRAAALGPLDVAAVSDRARRDDALLRQALGDRTDALHAPLAADLIADASHHAWIQIRWGTGWLEYDPTLPDSLPGQTLAAAASTSATMPDDAYQDVRIQVVAGSLLGSSVNDAVVLDRPFHAADIADSQLFLYFQPQLDSLGGTIVNTLSGVEGWTPVLMVDGEATPGNSFAAGGRGTDLFGDATDAPPLATLRIVITRSAPGQADVSAAHTLVDRVPQRLVGSDSIAATDLSPLAGDKTGPLALGVMDQILISTGGASPWLQAVRRGISADFLHTLLLDPDTADEHKLGDLMYPLAVANAQLVLDSEQLAVPAASDPGKTRAYVSAPRAFLVGIGQDLTAATDFAFTTDLLLDDVRVVGADATSAQGAALRGVWYGALESALETEATLQRAAGVSDQPSTLVSTSLDMMQPLTVLDSAASGTVGPPALRAATDAGAIAVVLGDPATARTWWTVDPATGATKAVLDPGLGGGYGSIAWGAIKHLPPPPRLGGAGGANVWHLNPDGSITRTPKLPGGGTPQGPPPSRCGGGSEYVTILGCVSIPFAWALRIGLSLILVEVVTDVAIYLLS